MSRTTNTPRYEQIANHVAEQIAAGVYQVGEAIPSVRQGVKRFKVSPGTLLEAYRTLETRGLIHARPQSGYYVCQTACHKLETPRPVTTSKKPRAISNHIAIEMLRQINAPNILQLGAAIPDIEYLPTRALSTRLARAVRNDSEALHRYGPITGALRLRQVLARWMGKRGSVVAPDQIVVTNGCSEAVHLALRAVTQPGDTVALESPTYYGFLLTLKSLGLRALPIETSPETGLAVDALAEAARTHRIAAVLVTPSHSNPTGAVMPASERDKLSAWALQTNTPLIEDDIYGELYFDAAAPPPLKAGPAADLVLYCNSFSKSLSPGLRLGWCAPGRYFDSYEQMKVCTNICTPLAAQYAVADYLHGGDYDRHLRQVRRRYRRQVERFRDALATQLTVPFRVNAPTGGHLLWVELDVKGANTVKLFDQLLKHNISIAPGPIFSASGGFSNCLRLNCAVSETTIVTDAIRTVAEAIRKQIQR